MTVRINWVGTINHTVHSAVGETDHNTGTVATEATFPSRFRIMAES